MGTSKTLGDYAFRDYVTDGVPFSGYNNPSKAQIRAFVDDVDARLGSITGGLTPLGVWNASTNSPTLVSSVGTAGNYYIVSVAGTTTLNGTSIWASGDVVLFTGGAWTKSQPFAATMTGDAGSGGTAGFVPAPPAGSTGQNKFLKANATWSTVPSTFLNVMDYGALADCAVGGTGTDNKTAFQNAINAAISQGRSLYVPGGRYYISGALTATEPGATTDGNTSHFCMFGDGPATTFLCFGAGNYTGLTISGPTGSYAMQAYVAIDGFAIEKTGADGLGLGLLLQRIAFSRFSNLKITGWADGIFGQDILSCVFTNIISRWNSNAGVFLQYVAYSRPNSITFLQCEISNNTNAGYALVNASAINIVGGGIQGNGIGGTSASAGILVSGGPSEGASGLNVYGCYFEYNAGIADISIDNSDYDGSYNFIGCTFNRLSIAAQTYTQKNIRVSGTANMMVNIAGCGFKRFGTYVASSSRPYIGVGSAPATKFNITGNYYGDAVENVPINGDNIQASAYARCIAYINGTSLVGGNNISSCVKNSTGNWTINYNQGFAQGNNIVVATVAGGVAVAWVTEDTPDHCRIQISTLGGAAVDLAVSVAVFAL